ncbi:cation:proton antiporter [Halolamina sp.]|jgi:CPA2 family monovalent cation:H+ antiporter-2|uniref:cation:proton antiporter n=1 Tax=Halolamina sp. TaxID=1940283 RepID=UPI000223BF74|nr:sodium/hydrogen exchanger [halophilic archaeon DL31]
MAGTLLLETGVLFAAVALAGLLASRLGLSAIPFYVLSGIALNEFVLGRAGLPYVQETAFVEVAAELGVVFLLFFLGLEFDPARLVADAERMGKAGLVDLGVNFSVGFGLGYVLFGGFVPAVLLGGIIYVSSSAVITKTMLDIGWIANPESGPILGTLVFEDLVVAVYLAVVSAAVLGGGSTSEVVQSVGIAFGFLLLLALFVYLSTRKLDQLLDTSSAEQFVLRTVGTTALIAGAGLALGVSEAVAAFFVGMAFGTTSFAHDVGSSLEPIRDTFAAVFFFWIGLGTDPFAFLGVLDLIALAVAISLPAKLLSGFVGGRLYGLDNRRSLRTGLGLVARGEFSLIIAAAALAAAGTVLSGEMASTIYAFTVGYVLAMTVLGTTLMGLSPAIERRVLPN